MNQSFKCYKCTNTLNGKIYIGCTKRTLVKRWKEHVRDALKNKPRYKRRYFYNAIRKYGGDVFVVELLGVFDSFQNMLDAEKKFVAQYNSTNSNIGYNSTSGGRQAEMTNEVKKKISDSLRRSLLVTRGEADSQAKLTQEQADQIRELYLTKQYTQDELSQLYNITRALISLVIEGARYTSDRFNITSAQIKAIRYKPETGRRISLANTGKKASDEARAKMSKVRQGKSRPTKNKQAVSKYFGVTIKTHNGKPWMARLTLPNSVRKYIGVFDSEIGAAKAYDSFVRSNKLDCPLNFPTE